MAPLLQASRFEVDMKFAVGQMAPLLQANICLLQALWKTCATFVQALFKWSGYPGLETPQYGYPQSEYPRSTYPWSGYPRSGYSSLETPGLETPGLGTLFGGPPTGMRTLIWQVLCQHCASLETLERDFGERLQMTKIQHFVSGWWFFLLPITWTRPSKLRPR